LSAFISSFLRYARDDGLERLCADDDLPVLGQIEGVELGGLLERDALEVAGGQAGVGGEGGVDQEDLALGAIRPTTLLTVLVFLTVKPKFSMTAISPAVARSKSARLNARAFTLLLIFLL
jgi:hypothetical protein